LNELVVRLHVQPKYLSDAPVTIAVCFTNQSDDDIFFIRSDTPFGGICPRCFRVMDLSGSKEVLYDGLLIKRGPPRPSTFEFLARQTSIETTIDLGTAYGVSSPGKYSVAYRGNVAFCKTALTGAVLTHWNTERAYSTTEFIHTEPVVFDVVAGSHKRLTLGERNRAAHLLRMPFAKGVAGLGLTAGTPTSPNLPDADPIQAAQITQAHNAGYGLMTSTIGQLANDANYATWFGSYTPDRFNKVTAIYNQMKYNMEGPPMTYSVNGPSCQSDWFAYTTYGSTTIWLCTPFWSAPATGTDSQAGTIVHEHSHCDANTVDVAAGTSACEQLALTDPDSAINNGDNFEYYAGG
jgi:peptidyl-Lys metalloendopeptidase